MSEEIKTLAERLFTADDPRSEIEDYLEESGIAFTKIGWDSYDTSLEIYGVDPSHRLNEEIQKFFFDGGFYTIFVNHTDAWETHYSLKKYPELKFLPSSGWRVSYPRKRGGGEMATGIWVEEIPEAWGKDKAEEWLKSGYVILKPSTSSESSS